MPSNHTMFRPPAEAFSLLLRVADGCPCNACSFCGMYKGVPYRVHPTREILDDLSAEVALDPTARRVFLADGDVMALPFDLLHVILTELNRCLPKLTRVSLYANGSSILKFSDAELTHLRQLRLHTLYMGLESGDQTILDHMHKPEQVDDMIEAGRKAQSCGLRMSVMVLIGLGGQSGSTDHVRKTAAVLNWMQPRLLSALRVIPVPGTRLFRDYETGQFKMLSEREATCELRDLTEALELEHTVFRANHTSNIVPLEGRFPKDKSRMLEELDALLASDFLDRAGPGPLPMFL